MTVIKRLAFGRIAVLEGILGRKKPYLHIQQVRIVELNNANKLLYHTNIHGIIIITKKTNRWALGDGTDAFLL